MHCRGCLALRQRAACAVRCPLPRFRCRVLPGYTGDRYSCIFYKTVGQPHPIQSAVFDGSEAFARPEPDPPTYCAPADAYYRNYCKLSGTYSPPGMLMAPTAS